MSMQIQIEISRPSVQMRRRFLGFGTIMLALMLTTGTSRLLADNGICNLSPISLPFNDVAGNAFFCSIAAAYFSGLTNGTSATTYSPGNNVTREQMAAFIARTHDRALKRGSRRAALNQWTLPSSVPATGRTDVNVTPRQVACDGADLWVATDNNVERVRASDGKLLETWETGADYIDGVLVARGRIFVTGPEGGRPRLYVIDPTQAPALVPIFATLRECCRSRGIAFSGYYIWVATDFDVVRVDPNSGAVTTYTTGFTTPYGMISDGSNIWITDQGDNSLKKLNANGTVARSIAVGSEPRNPIFDGMNIWVPSAASNTVTAVRVKDSQGAPLTNPFLLATLTGNGLNGPESAAFDGERILVTNFDGDSISLWKAADLSRLGEVAGAPAALGACSDGLNFWITLYENPGKLARF